MVNSICGTYSHLIVNIQIPVSPSNIPEQNLKKYQNGNEH